MKGFLVDFYSINGEKMGSKSYEVETPNDAAIEAEKELENNFCIYCNSNSEIIHTVGVISSKVSRFNVSRFNR